MTCCISIPISRQPPSLGPSFGTIPRHHSPLVYRSSNFPHEMAMGYTPFPDTHLIWLIDADFFDVFCSTRKTNSRLSEPYSIIGGIWEIDAETHWNRRIHWWICLNLSAHNFNRSRKLGHRKGPEVVALVPHTDAKSLDHGLTMLDPHHDIRQLWYTQITWVGDSFMSLVS